MLGAVELPLLSGKSGRAQARPRLLHKNPWGGGEPGRSPCSPWSQLLLFISPLQGITTYFSENCTLEDAKMAQDFLDSQVWAVVGWSSPPLCEEAGALAPGSPHVPGRELSTVQPQKVPE